MILYFQDLSGKAIWQPARVETCHPEERIYFQKGSAENMAALEIHIIRQPEVNNT